MLPESNMGNPSYSQSFGFLTYFLKFYSGAAVDLWYCLCLNHLTNYAGKPITNMVVPWQFSSPGQCFQEKVGW